MVDTKYVTTISIKKTTRERIEKFGRMHESYSDVIERVFDAYEKNEKEHEKKK